MKTNTEITICQSRKTLAKGIIEIALDECIQKINQEIEQEKSESVKYTVSPLYINGLTKAKNIISEMKRIVSSK